jgi:hypothetical protein
MQKLSHIDFGQEFYADNYGQFLFYEQAPKDLDSDIQLETKKDIEFLKKKFEESYNKFKVVSEKMKSSSEVLFEPEKLAKLNTLLEKYNITEIKTLTSGDSVDILKLGESKNMTESEKQEFMTLIREFNSFHTNGIINFLDSIVETSVKYLEEQGWDGKEWDKRMKDSTLSESEKENIVELGARKYFQTHGISGSFLEVVVNNMKKSAASFFPSENEE